MKGTSKLLTRIRENELGKLGAVALVAASVAGVTGVAADAALGAEGPSTRMAFEVLLGESLFPDGIAIDPDNGDIFVSGFADGSIQKVSPPGDASYFETPGSNGLVNPLGMDLDADRDRLWVSNASFTGPGDIRLYDTADGSAPLAVFPQPADGFPHFFNDLAVSKDGSVYITDSFQPRVWKIGPDMGSIEVFAEDPAFLTGAPGTFQGALNGVAVTPDDRYVIVTTMNLGAGAGGRLFRVERDSGAVTEVALTGDTATFGGGDGIAFDTAHAHPVRHRTLYAVGVAGSGSSLYSVHFNPSYTEAEITGLGDLNRYFDVPTTVATDRKHVWIVNGQTNHVFDFGDGQFGTAPNIPFTLTGVPHHRLKTSP
jgi:sugar lactone lactonase YvrE